MKFCFYCRHEIPDRASFCSACGEDQDIRDSAEKKEQNDAPEKVHETSQGVEGNVNESTDANEPVTVVCGIESEIPKASVQTLVANDFSEPTGSEDLPTPSNTAAIKSMSEKTKRKWISAAIAIGVICALVLGGYAKKEYDKSRYIADTKSAVRSILHQYNVVNMTFYPTSSDILAIRATLNTERQKIIFISPTDSVTETLQQEAIKLTDTLLSYLEIYEKYGPIFQKRAAELNSIRAQEIEQVKKRGFRLGDFARTNAEIALEELSNKERETYRYLLKTIQKENDHLQKIYFADWKPSDNLQK